MRLQASLKHSDYTDDMLNLRFYADIMTAITCGSENDRRIIHRTVVGNGAWGVRLRGVVVEYRTDSKDITLCAGRKVEGCPGGKTLTFMIPEVPQEYWEGEEKTIEVRACLASDSDARDFNVSYTVSCEPYSRESAAAGEKLVMHSNMLVRVV